MAHLPAHEVEDPVHVGQHGIDLVGHEDDRRAGLAPPLVDEVGHGLLAGQVEGEQRLVAQQDLGVAEQRLGDAEALLLAAREQADGRVGVGAGADGVKCLVHPFPDGPGVARQTPAVAVDAEADEVAPADGQGAVEGLLLGHVAELVVAQPRRGAVDAHRARRPAGRGPSSTLSSVVLPAPLGPSTARNSPSATSRSRPDHRSREPRRTAAPRSSTGGRVTGCGSTRARGAARSAGTAATAGRWRRRRASSRRRRRPGMWCWRARSRIWCRDRRHGLHVVEQHVDVVVVEQALHGQRVRRAGVGAVLDGPGEARTASSTSRPATASA